MMFDRSVPIARQVDLLIFKANSLIRADQSPLARDYCQRALALSQPNDQFAAGYPLGEAKARVLAGYASLHLGNDPQEMESIKLAIATLEPLDEPLFLARAYGALTWFYINSFDIATALSYAKRALLYAENAKEPFDLADSLITYANAQLLAGNHDSAIQLARNALQIGTQNAIDRIIAGAHNNLAIMLLDAGDQNSALFHARQAFDLSSKDQEIMRMANAADTIGAVLLAMGQPEEALTHFQQAIDLGMQHSAIIQANCATIAHFQFQYAHCLLQMGNPKDALPIALESKAIADQTNQTRLLLSLWQLLANISEAQQEHKQALLYLKEYIHLKDHLTGREANGNMISKMVAHQMHIDRLQTETLQLENKALANQIKNEQMRANELEYIASTDPLTGLFNRRKFQQLAEHALQLAYLTHKPVCLLAIDLDHFKAINDAHGHIVGDRVLVKLAELLTKSIRLGDAAARYGGEEFFVILSDSNAATAGKIAERIRQAASELHLNSDSAPVSFTISIGIADNQGQDPLENMIHRADQALYRAKQNGRNQVQVA